MNLCHHVESNLQTRALLGRGEKLLAAVSGGIDSMVLLHLLHGLAPDRGLELAVAHFNHQLRGRHSDRDAQFVRKRAEDLGVPFFGGEGDVKSFAAKSGLSLEMAARKLRHEFLAATARAGNFSAIALAHHADDQVELFFLRVLRGAGGEGLAGMKWRSASPMDKRIVLIRPLLDISKTELAEFARESNIKWCEDATNGLLDIPRNRVRNELLPLLRAQYQPGLTRTVLRLMDIVGAEAEVVADAAERWLKDEPSTISFASLPVAVQRRVLISQFPALGLPMDFEWVEQLREQENNPVNVGLNLFATRDARGKVIVSEKTATSTFNEEELNLNLTGRTGKSVFAGVAIAWERLALRKRAAAPRAQMNRLAGRELFDAAWFGTSVVLRHWRPGDRFQPLGMAAAVKLQDLFTNAKIPARQRRKLLVATTAGEIFWVEGLRMAERFKVVPGTKQGLVWRWQRAE